MRCADLHEIAHAFLDQQVVDVREHGGHGDARVLLVDALGRARASAAVREVQTVRARVDPAQADELDPGGGHELERAAYRRVEVPPAL